MPDNLNALPYLAYSYGSPDTAVRMGVNDTNYTVTASDTLVAFAALTASRTVTLPNAASVPAGQQVVIKDETGNCSGSITITVSGSIDGASQIILNSAYANVRLYSTGSVWAKVGI